MRAGLGFRLEAPSALVLVLSLSSLAAGAPPKVNYLYPAGGQRGQSVAVTAAGDFSTWPVQVWSDRPGIKATAEKDKGKFTLDLAADAAAGTYWLRFFNSDGASVLRPFVVGTLAEIVESEPNDAPDKPQAVEPRVVANGKLGKSGDVDGYRVELKQGETLVASLMANSTLGAPMDAVLQVCELVERPSSSRLTGGSSSSEATRHVEAFVLAQNHDAVGLDPQIAFTAPHSGAYLVRVFAFPATPDSSVRFAGGDDYLYRLTLTTGPFIDHALPLAATREESPVLLGGWNLEAAASAIVPPLSAEADLLTPLDSPLVWIWRKDAAGAMVMPRVDYGDGTPRGGASNKEENHESNESNESGRGVGTRNLPATYSGRLAAAGQTDEYAFLGKKDQKLRLRVAAKALGFPTDGVILILDEAGKKLAEADDTGRDDRDPQLDFTPPADGRYRVLVRDLARRGDVRMVYRLTIEQVQPDFALSLAADSFVLEKGKPLEITVNVTVRDGLKEPIEIQAIGLPAGVTAEPVKFQPSGDSPMPDSGGGRRGRKGGSAPPAGPSVKLVLKGDSEAAAAGGGPIRIEGRCGVLTRTARFPLNLPLAGSHHATWLTVK
jgi:hypothetical protein